MVQAIGNYKKWYVTRPRPQTHRVYLVDQFLRDIRHGSHVGALRHAAICALDLGNQPLALDDHVLLIEVRLKFEHADLPLNKKYEPVAGLTVMVEETADMLSRTYLPFNKVNTGLNTFLCLSERNGGTDIFDGIKAANYHMRKKGGMGVATIFMQAHDVVDVVKAVLPSPTVAKIAQAADNWG
jgi:hypothetical protein